MTDVWKLETPAQDEAAEDLNLIIEKAMRFGGVSERAYLKKLWERESWQRIKAKLNAGGSVWYVWYMDGVNQHLMNMLAEST